MSWLRDWELKVGTKGWWAKSGSKLRPPQRPEYRTIRTDSFSEASWAKGWIRSYVLVSFPLLWETVWQKRQLSGQRGLFQFTVPACHAREVKAETSNGQSHHVHGQDQRVRNACLLTCLYSAEFLHSHTVLKPFHREWCHPYWPKHAHRPAQCRQSLVRTVFPSCVKLSIKVKHHIEARLGSLDSFSMSEDGDLNILMSS